MLYCLDFDGVIADSLDQQLDIVTQAQRLVGAGRKPTVDDFRTIENLSYEGFAALIGLDEGLVPVWKATVQRLLAADEREIPLFPGVIEAIGELASNTEIAIITSNITESVSRILVRNDLARLVTRIYDGAARGSKSDKIRQAAADYALPIDKIAMVGDTRSDIRHGREAGARTIAVTWGYQSRETLELERPDVFADSPFELVRLRRSGIESVGLH